MQLLSKCSAPHQMWTTKPKANLPENSNFSPYIFDQKLGICALRHGSKKKTLYHPTNLFCLVATVCQHQGNQTWRRDCSHSQSDLKITERYTCVQQWNAQTTDFKWIARSTIIGIFYCLDCINFLTFIDNFTI